MILSRAAPEAPRAFIPAEDWNRRLELVSGPEACCRCGRNPRSPCQLFDTLFGDDIHQGRAIAPELSRKIVRGNPHFLHVFSIRINVGHAVALVESMEAESMRKLLDSAANRWR